MSKELESNKRRTEVNVDKFIEAIIWKNSDNNIIKKARKDET